MEHRELCRMLDRLTPGLLPRDVFHSVARLMVTTTFVVVPLVKRQDKMFVRLQERDASDLYYPSMLNTPGTVIRASDEDLPAVYRRLVSTELAGVPIKQGPIFVGNVFERIVRGREVSLIHWVEMDDTVPSHQLFDVDKLPENVVPTDGPRIQMAVNHFRTSTASLVSPSGQSHPARESQA